MIKAIFPLATLCSLMFSTPVAFAQQAPEKWVCFGETVPVPAAANETFSQFNPNPKSATNPVLVEITSLAFLRNFPKVISGSTTDVDKWQSWLDPLTNTNNRTALGYGFGEYASAWLQPQCTYECVIEATFETGSALWKFPAIYGGGSATRTRSWKTYVRTTQRIIGE